MMIDCLHWDMVTSQQNSMSLLWSDWTVHSMHRHRRCSCQYQYHHCPPSVVVPWTFLWFLFSSFSFWLWFLFLILLRLLYRHALIFPFCVTFWQPPSLCTFLRDGWLAATCCSGCWCWCSFDHRLLTLSRDSCLLLVSLVDRTGCHDNCCHRRFLDLSYFLHERCPCLAARRLESPRHSGFSVSTTGVRHRAWILVTAMYRDARMRVFGAFGTAAVMMAGSPQHDSPSSSSCRCCFLRCHWLPPPPRRLPKQQAGRQQ
mmetsp:Transcript_28250/g.79350  ORF Transcript_28250/g.79350 Transcript_28250/m.79350 type:complete len:258 (-) Transcript_28250:239-1012(-)